jgi:hypothetical protein
VCDIGTETVIISQVLYKVSCNIDRRITDRTALATDKMEVGELFCRVISRTTMAKVCVLN